jgi:FkbH-like protein
LDASFSGYEDISFTDETANVYIWFYLPPYRPDNSIAADGILNYSNLLALTLSKHDSSKPFLVFSMQSIYGIHYQTSDHTIEEAVHRYNRRIHQLEEENVNVKIINIEDFYSRFSAEELIDWKYYFLSQMPLNPKLSSHFSLWLSRQLEVVEMKRKKCIVLDLDNTLWGGILGEDGMDGIQLGNDYPGVTYVFFQKYLLELCKNGILLTVCSKNNEADVLEVWEKHPGLILRKEHIVAYRINWNNKSDNIREIAEELNIGLESLVFIDDNPAERELIKQMLPQVTVPDFPAQPYLFPGFVKALTHNHFSTYRLTKDDVSKTQQYRENSKRVQFQHQFADFDNYLRNLEIELTVEPLDGFNLSRIAQMTQKTNQFNLTTRRYMETDIRNFAETGGWVYGLNVKDRFGDNGLTGLIIIEIRQTEAIIDTFLLSCRILGKKIENAFIRFMLMKLKNSGVSKVDACYLKTAKNSQVATFYDDTGFKLKSEKGDVKTYSMNLDTFNFTLSDLYKINEK